MNIRSRIILLFVVITLHSCREPIKKYYSSGELFSVTEGSSDNYDGNYKEYYKTGEIKKTATYVNNKLNGTIFDYLQNGDTVSMFPIVNYSTMLSITTRHSASLI